VSHLGCRVGICVVEQRDECVQHHVPGQAELLF
jgi:hypothetical protein